MSAKLWWAGAVLLLASGSAAADPCADAWAAYNAFKARNVMAPELYPFTEQGKAVRDACGEEALPVPPGADTPHRPPIRKPAAPTPPPPKTSKGKKSELPVGS